MKHLADLKQEVAALGAETEVGFRAEPRAVARIRALAAELEAMNPTPEPARAAALLRGHWKLLYSNIALQRTASLASLSFRMLPEVQVHVAELFNDVDPATGLWDNVITFEDAETGEPGTAVTLGAYRVTDEDRLALRFGSALVTGAAAQVRRPIAAGRSDDLSIRVTYLDDGFRMLRGERGSLYIFERLDAAPMRWARDG